MVGGFNHMIKQDPKNPLFIVTLKLIQSRDSNQNPLAYDKEQEITVCAIDEKEAEAFIIQQNPDAEVSNVVKA